MVRRAEEGVGGIESSPLACNLKVGSAPGVFSGVFALKLVLFQPERGEMQSQPLPERTTSSIHEQDTSITFLA